MSSRGDGTPDEVTPKSCAQLLGVRLGGLPSLALLVIFLYDLFNKAFDPALLSGDVPNP